MEVAAANRLDEDDADGNETDDDKAGDDKDGVDDNEGGEKQETTKT